MKNHLLIFFFFLSLSAVAQKSGELDSILNHYDKANAFHGTVLVAKDNKVILNKGFGLASVAAGIRNTSNSVYPIGSVTKQFTATVIMKLQEEGRLSVNDPVSKYFPELKGSDKITIHHLLTHRAGLPNYTDDTSIWYSTLSEPKLISFLNEGEPVFSPGTKYQYNNSGYILAGYIIEKTTGKKYERVVRDVIFKPLGMTNSGFDFQNLKSPHKTVGYYDNGTMFIPARHIDSTIAYSAGAIYSTTDDMFKWAGAIKHKIIVAPSSWAAMTTDHGHGYGYGLVIDSLHGERNIWHNGGLDGFVSNLCFLPEKDITIIILSNYNSSEVMKLGDVLVACLLDKPYALPVIRNELKLAGDSLIQYAGHYPIVPEFAITVTVDGDKLMAQATGQAAYQVFPQKPDYFFYKIVDAQIQFERDNNGKVKGLILYQNGMQLKGVKKE